MAEPRKALFLASRPIGYAEGKPIYADQAFLFGLQHITNLVGGSQGILPESIAGGSTFGIVYIGSAGGLTSIAPLTNGQVIIGSTGAAPVGATITGTAGEVAVANAAGSITLSFNGTIAATKGGTGLSTYTLGDTLYSSASNTLAKLAGNTTTTKKYLSQTGNGSVSAAPIWDDTIVSGTYTPTLTNVANLAASTTYQAQYMRVGNTVTVSGRVDIDPTLAATSTQLGISLPVASNFGATEDCAGVAFASGIATQGAAILADTANDRAQLQYISGDTTNQAMYFTFTYQVIA